jgi:hypothetical protein
MRACHSLSLTLRMQLTRDFQSWALAFISRRIPCLSESFMFLILSKYTRLATVTGSNVVMTSSPTRRGSFVKSNLGIHCLPVDIGVSAHVWEIGSGEKCGRGNTYLRHSVHSPSYVLAVQPSSQSLQSAPNDPLRQLPVSFEEDTCGQLLGRGQGYTYWERTENRYCPSSTSRLSRDENLFCWGGAKARGRWVVRFGCRGWGEGRGYERDAGWWCSGC